MSSREALRQQARAYVDKLDILERIERQIANFEARRAASYRELMFYRETEEDHPAVIEGEFKAIEDKTSSMLTKVDPQSAEMPLLPKTDEGPGRDVNHDGGCEAAT